MTRQDFIFTLFDNGNGLSLNQIERIEEYLPDIIPESMIEDMQEVNGMSEEDARALLVSGFADNVSKELPLEYAVEMNNLIRLEMKGSIG